MRVHRWAGLAVGIAVLAACADSSNGLEPEFQLASVGTIVDLLEGVGLTVKEVGPVVQSFYPTAAATLLRANGEDVTVFEYETADEARQQSGVRPLVSWTKPPHFYLSGRFMVLYVGTSGTLLDALEDVLGEELDP